jgi:peptidyl-prolyl cis-trans isomerase C
MNTPSLEPRATDRRSQPQLPSACASGGCGCGTGSASPSTAGVPAATVAAPIRIHRAGAAPASESLPPANAPVRVNGKEIPAQSIADEAQLHPAPDAAAAWEAAARALAVRELLLQEAQRLNLVAEPEVDEAGRREVDSEAVIRTLLETHAPHAPPTREECRRVYEQRKQRFRSPPLLEVGHILIEPATHDEVGWKQAEAHACLLASELGDDPADFAEAARAFSRCPSAHQGGSLGQLQPGEVVPAVESAFAALQEGRTGREPVRSRFGWHVLRLERRIPERDLPFELVESRIVDMLESRDWVLSAARYTAQLVAAATVEGVRLSIEDLEEQLW